ncbi:MAG: hypothetical protein Q8S58_06655 [Bosea sp. (in: a-proteobacteria)]|uniref:hypothetical protein n=1 Tax=Bosea sp. (in: a-proteobacteria) TaxID=1871050 RepID=UPI002735429B|nr:hypothetical protein [Bosea sp. (in: a-proteobacteria)]MDP3255674.1 hypothetical protein [Bosea sp. (in: a-proteobacteria)]MDP3318794.1 hypothetical protein [Bosea sp. (in: a-proteobacteria)]
MNETERSQAQAAWTRWTIGFFGSVAVTLLVLWGFASALDPFGLRVVNGHPPRPIMDINQRFMYPQLVRSGRFDSAIFGTSTMRLLDPAALSEGIGGRFANLAMNAATPWEQIQMADLFARQVATPRSVLWGIDSTWCEADATDPAKRLTPRPFPPWLYDGVGWRDWPQLMNLTTLEIAARLLAHHLGLMPERIRGDGYEVFTPPEPLYDLARARMHLYADRGGVAPEPGPIVPPESVSSEARAQWRFPALDWLDQALSRLPPQTRVLLVLPPAHYAMMPREGSIGGQHYDACKRDLAAMAARHGATVIDYALNSPITRRDENYWDRVHYRLPIARRIEADLVAVANGRPPQADGAVAVTQPR